MLNNSKQRIIEFTFKQVTAFAAAMVPIALVGIVVMLWHGSGPSLHAFGLHFLVSHVWNPVTEKFGAVVPVYGTIITSVIALIIAVPVSFGIALFLTEISPRLLRTPLGMAIDLLAAIPSIIFGMWGLFVFAPFFANTIEPWITTHVGNWPIVGAWVQGPPMGIGVFTAGFILAIMIIPFISAVMRDVFLLVPPVLKESAYGTGATTWEVVSQIVLPETRAGVVGGIILGLGRALGETMAVTFVIGNAHQLTRSLFMPGATISSTLANEFTEAIGPIYTSSLIELGLILFVLTFLVLATAKWILWSVKRKNEVLA